MASHVREVGSRAGGALAWLHRHAETDDDQCFTWPFGKGYKGRPSMRVGSGTKNAQRVFCAIVNGPPPDGSYQAAHSCGKGHMSCMNPRHLRWATQNENEADKISHGTSNRGERHGMAKHDEGKIREILALKGSMTIDDAATALGVSKWTVGDVWRGRRWSWLQ